MTSKDKILKNCIEALKVLKNGQPLIDITKEDFIDCIIDDIEFTIRSVLTEDEKATPKRPITIKPEGTSIFDYPTNRIKCPNCGVQLPMKKNCLKKKNPINYCNRCGQKLDWSDVDE